MRRLEKIAFKHGDWWFWTKHRNPLKVMLNFFVCFFCFLCPFPEIKNPLLKLIGMNIGKNVYIAMGSALDIFYPELIEIGEHAIIGYGCVITAHELVQNELRIGAIYIGANTVIGVKSTVLAGVHVGEGAIISAMSLVNKDIPRNGFYGGVPAKKLR